MVWCRDQMSPGILKSSQPKPQASDVEGFIYGAIRRGDLKPGERIGSARELAQEWNTSYGAVRQSLESLAAKGILVRRPRAGTFVNSELSSNLVPDDPADARRHIIGLLVPDIRVPEHSFVTRHLQDAAHAEHLEVLVSSTDNERQRYDQSIARHIRAGVGGLILMSPQQARVSLESLLEIQKSGIPVVNYGRSLDIVNWPTVQTNVQQGAYLAVQHLCALGRRNIGFISYAASRSINLQMSYGVYKAAHESPESVKRISELAISPEVYLQSNGWADNSALCRLLEAWLAENPDIDAIHCTHDHIAGAVLATLRKSGRRVPDDVAVAGMGRMGEFFGLAPGELTTVDTCLDKAAGEMLRLLREQGNRDPDRPAEVVEIEPQLVIGRSTVSDTAS